MHEDLPASSLIRNVCIGGDKSTSDLESLGFLDLMDIFSTAFFENSNLNAFGGSMNPAEPDISGHCPNPEAACSFRSLSLCVRFTITSAAKQSLRIAQGCRVQASCLSLSYNPFILSAPW